jgi:hypothetical protein
MTDRQFTIALGPFDKFFFLVVVSDQGNFLISPYLNGVLQHFVAHVDDHLIFLLFKVLSAQEMLGLNNAA